MNGVKVTKSVTLNLGPRDWQLYTMRGDTDAAYRLNTAVTAAINEPNSVPATVTDAFYAASKAEEMYGATDTEPRNVFYDILDKVYGRAA